MTSKPSSSLSTPSAASAAPGASSTPSASSTAGSGLAPQGASADPAAQAATRPRIVPCPTCGGDSIFAPSNLWRPFCGERCRQIDLGHWADESFRVAAPPTTEDENDAEH